jgi:hypothetical protein
MTSTDDVLTMFTIFRSPADYPGKFVLRGFDVIRGQAEPRPHAVHVVCDSLEQVRACVPSGLYCIGREPGDHESVVETWL